MRHYVSVSGVSDETLEFVGYVLVSEDADTKIYSHFGEEVIVDKEDPFIYVDDINDLPFMKGDVIIVPVGDGDD
jgi:hypothetical protein